MKEFFIPKRLSRKEIEIEGGKLGGSDFNDWWEYIRRDTVPSFDKGEHKKRSIANDPNHLDHWKKKGGE